MKKLKKLYLSNPIIQFLYSYILVLIIPIVILFYGFNNAFSIVENDIKESNIAMLTQSMYLINEEVHALESLSLQTSQSAALRELGTMTERNGDYITTVKELMSEFYRLINYQSLPLLEDSYIYLNEMDLIIYDNSVYRPEVFAQHIAGWGMTLEEWYSMCKNTDNHAPHYFISSDGSIQYVMPFSSSLFGSNNGVIVYRYDKKEFGRLLSFTSEYEKYSIFILDNNNRILYSEDQLELGDSIHFESLNTTGFSSLDSKISMIVAQEILSPDFKEAESFSFAVSGK